MPPRKKAGAGNGNGANLGFEQKLWLAADKLRNNMDAAEYKHVVLGLIFLKYISDRFEQRHAELLAAQSEGADPEDRDEYLADNIFWVPKEARWSFLQKNAKQPNIPTLVDEAMVAIERDNPSLKGVLPKDYTRPALDRQRLGELIDLIGTIGLGDEESRSQDILGRVYEYFLGQFASAEGINAGQFYTPRSVVKLLVAMIEPYRGRVYDPCCGSGGMFVQSERFVEEHGGHLEDISIYGQESNATTWRLAKMNLAIRGIDGNIAYGDTFHDDQHPDLKADFILANPPFNDSDWRGKLLREDKRWKYGPPPVSNANYAWVQHFVHHLSPRGLAGFVLAINSLASESGAENDIRRGIVEDDLVDCIVTLPGKLFYSTPIPVSLWFIARDKGDSRYRKRFGEVLLIDASRFGMEETRTHSYLTDQDIESIVSTYHRWRGNTGGYHDVPGFCRSVTLDEIRSRAFNLFPAAYVGIEHLDSSAPLGGPGATDLPGLWAVHQDVIRRIGQSGGSLTRIAPSANSIVRPSQFVTVKLAEVLERSDERLGNQMEPEILTCTERAGLVFQKERFAKRIATEDTTKYKVVRKTDIVYNPYLLWAGAIDQCWIVEMGITSPAYEVLRVRDGFDPTLVGALLKSEKMIRVYGGISIGTVQRRRRAAVERFLELEVTIPSPEEQTALLVLTSALQDMAAQYREGGRIVNDMLRVITRSWLLT